MWLAGNSLENNNNEQHVVLSLPLAGTVKLWQIARIVIAAILCVLGVVLWIAVGVVLLNPPNGSKSRSLFLGQK